MKKIFWSVVYWGYEKYFAVSRFISRVKFTLFLLKHRRRGVKYEPCAWYVNNGVKKPLF